MFFSKYRVLESSVWPFEGSLMKNLINEGTTASDQKANQYDRRVTRKKDQKKHYFYIFVGGGRRRREGCFW